MIQKIIKLPQPSLWSACKPIDFSTVDRGALLEHIRDLKDTLAATPHGVALASNQIAPLGFRVFVIRPGIDLRPVSTMAGGTLGEVVINPVWRPYVPHQIDTDPRKFNPEWVKEHDSFVEGCLSVPELNRRKPREYWIEVEYDDEDGQRGITVCQGLAARIVQHECDHLDGRLIYDDLPPKDKVKVKAQAIVNRKKGR